MVSTVMGAMRWIVGMPQKGNINKKSNDTNKEVDTGKQADNHDIICITDTRVGKVLCCITHHSEYSRAETLKYFAFGGRS